MNRPLDADGTALAAAIEAIRPLDETAMATARARLAQLTKPVASLGRLEDLVVELAGISGRPDAPVERRTIVVAAADHGVVARGVSAYPSDVTVQMVANYLAGGAAINVLADWADIELVVVDAGLAGPIPERSGPTGRPRSGGRLGRLVEGRIRPGTADLSRGPAMARVEALAAIRTGLDLVSELATDGLDLLGVGEMGIGNTTAASAITAVLTGRSPITVTGRGTGIDDAGHRHKVEVIEEAIRVSRPDRADPVDVLAAVGGLEIGVIVGLVLGAGRAEIPVVLDGFVTGAAALVAVALQPAVAARLVASHRSTEPGHAAILDHLGLVPVLDLSMRLGEGTGAALAMNVIAAAVRLRDGMATFASAGVAGPVVGPPGEAGLGQGGGLDAVAG